MRKSILLSIVVILNMNCLGTRIQEPCSAENMRVPTNNYIEIINTFYCNNSDSGDFEYNPYCDTSGYEIYSLFKNDSSELVLVKAKMTMTGGKEGDDFTIFEINNNTVIEPLNVFTGYLDCIKKTSAKYPDIIFSCPIDSGRIKVQVSRTGKYYHKRKVLDIEGNDMNKKHKKKLLKEYNSEDESHIIKRWE